MAGKSYTVTAIFEAVDKVTKTLAGIERSVSKLGVTTKNVERVSKGASGVFSGLGQMLKGVGNIALGAARGVGTIAGAIIEAIPGAKAIGTVFQRAGAAIKFGVTDGIEKASAKIRGFISNMAPLKNLFASNSVFGRAGAMFEAFGSTVANVARPILTGVGQIASGFGRIAAGAAGMARGVLGAVGNVGMAIASKIGGAVQSAIPHLQTAGNVALKAFGVVSTAALAAGVTLLSFTTSAAGMQNVQAAFDGIAAASGKSGDEVLAALEKGSAGMISQRDLMLSYNKASQLVSKDFANQLPDAMQYLSKVASATGQDMGFLMDSLVVGVGRLAPAILDNLAIQVSLEEATARAAKMFGVQADSLTKAQQQAGMMAVVTEKLAANTAAMPEIAGTAAAQLATMGAQIQNAKDQVGLALVPALQQVLPLLLGFLDRVTGLIPSVERFGQVLAAFFEYIRRGGNVFQGFTAALALLGVPPDVIAKIREFGAAVQQVIAWASPYVAMIAGWLGEHVKLQDVLIALGAAIASVVIPAIGSVIAVAAPVIAVIAAVIAIAALLRTAWEENWGGIQEKAAAVATWLSTNVPIALAAISNFVTGTLIPALQNIWSFVQANVIPIFQALGDLLSAVVGVAVTALAGLWQNVLLPALQAAGAWISDTFGPILEKFNGWLKSVSDGVGGVSGAVSSVIGWLEKMADKMSSLKLPKWLTPGSPTPFEIGLRGIGSAARQLARADFPQLGSSLSTFPSRAPVEMNSETVDNHQEIGEINLYNTGNDSAMLDRLTWRLRRKRVYGGA